MIFNTWVFGGFALLVLGAYWTVVPQRAKPAFLIATGIVFYAYAVPAYLALIAALGAVTYAIAQALLRTERPRVRRLLLATGVVTIGSVLIAFKYTHFLAVTVDQIAARRIVPVPTLVVPLAISFFTFEFVHVLVDVALRKIRRIDPLDFAVFTMFFPTLVAGPIKRYQTFAPQVQAIELPAPATAAAHLYRIVMGLAKKYVIADSMTLLTQPILAPGAPFSTPDYWIAMLAYTAKIYFDFTGYSDIAIGIAGLLGLRVPENFDRPYRARNIAEFWRRWHMSLSSWIRDYIFIPLGGSRRPPALTAANVFIAMVIAGLWHGAAWTFALWGLWHGIGLATHRLWMALAVPRLPGMLAAPQFVAALSIVVTFGFVAFGWVLFAATSVTDAATVYRHLLAL